MPLSMSDRFSSSGILYSGKINTYDSSQRRRTAPEASSPAHRPGIILRVPFSLQISA